MGCDSSKEVIMEKIIHQEKKIDNLVELNKNFERRLNDLQKETMNTNKTIWDTNPDLTGFKLNIDTRFAKIEKTLEKIHSSARLHYLDGIDTNTDTHPKKSIATPAVKENNEESLSLAWDKEAIQIGFVNKPTDVQWNILLHDSNMASNKNGNNMDEVIEDKNLQRNEIKSFKKLDGLDSQLNQNYMNSINSGINLTKKIPNRE